MSLICLGTQKPSSDTICQLNSGNQLNLMPVGDRYLETQISFEMLRNELAKGGRPTSFWERGLCWIAGVDEKHYKNADEAVKKTLRRRTFNKVADLVNRDSLFGLINLKERQTFNPVPQPHFDLKYETEQLHERLMKLNYRNDHFSRKFLVEWVQTDALESVHYQIPLYGDDTSTDKPTATLHITYNKTNGDVTVETKFTGRSLYLGIQLRALAMTLEIHAGLLLDQPPSLDWNELSLQWRTNNSKELFRIFELFEQMYKITFTNWGIFWPESCIFPYTWDKAWFPTFISTMLQVDHIHDSSLKMSYLETADALSWSCSPPCFDHEKLALSVIDTAINDPLQWVRKIAFGLIFRYKNPQFLESVAYRAWNERDKNTPMDSINLLCNILESLGTYDASLEITNGLLANVLAILNEEKIDSSSVSYSNIVWEAVELSWRLTTFIQNNYPVDIPKVVELAEFLSRLVGNSNYRHVKRYVKELCAALNDKGIIIC